MQLGSLNRILIREMALEKTHMNQTAGEVVRIGASGARIVRVTQERIEYIDMAGPDQFIDLEECARSWGRWYDIHSHEFFPVPGCRARVRWHEVRSHEFLPTLEVSPGPPSQTDIDAWNARCVGQRGGGDPLWRVEFMNKRKTRFEFETWEALWRELQGRLMVAGWNTFDTE
jgi:hypothetical protein